MGLLETMTGVKPANELPVKEHMGTLISSLMWCGKQHS